MEREPIIAEPNEVKFFLTMGGILLGIILISFLIADRRQKVDPESLPLFGVATTTPFENMEIRARAAYVVDLRTGQVLFEKNADEKLPLASLTKVMSALVAHKIASPSSEIVVTEGALEKEGDSGLLNGERWKLKDLLDFSLTSSSNDGTAAVAIGLGALNRTSPTDEEARGSFVGLMNEKAQSLGMSNTLFINETGLDETLYKNGAEGSAKDMAKLFSYILRNYPELLEATKHPFIQTTSLDNITHTAINTDVIVSDIPGIKASKTGYTDVAGGNLVIVFDPELGRPVAISILGSSAQGRFSDMERLVKATMEAIQLGR